MNIAICDNEQVQLDILEKSIYRCPVEGWRPGSTFKYSSGQALLQDMENGRDFTYIFLDIHMPEMSGLQVCAELAEKTRANIIFVSTHGEALPEVYGLGRIYFIFKPYTQDTFNRTMQIVLKNQASEYLFSFQADGISQSLPCSQIRFLKSEDHYVQIVTDDMTYMARGKLDDAAKELELKDFFRCHRGFLINLRYYRTRAAQHVLLSGGTELVRIPLSKARASALDSAYLKYRTGGEDAF